MARRRSGREFDSNISYDGTGEDFSPLAKLPRPGQWRNDQVFDRLQSVPDHYLFGAAEDIGRSLDRRREFRRFNFSPYRARPEVVRSGHKFGPALRVWDMKPSSQVRFCVRRKERREVLFAFNRAGYRGSARKRSWRRTPSSQWGC